MRTLWPWLEQQAIWWADSKGIIEHLSMLSPKEVCKQKTEKHGYAEERNKKSGRRIEY